VPIKRALNSASRAILRPPIVCANGGGAGAPVAIPRQSWASLEEAKRGAENFALMALPTDPKVAARIKKVNETPHPMGPPLNRLCVAASISGGR